MDYFFGSYGAAARAAFVVEEAEDFAQGVSVGAVPEKGAVATDIHKADLFQFFEVVRQCGGGDFQFVLNFACVHASWMRGEQGAHDLKAGFGTEGGEAVGSARDEERIGFAHISIIVEI